MTELKIATPGSTVDQDLSGKHDALITLGDRKCIYLTGLTGTNARPDGHLASRELRS